MLKQSVHAVEVELSFFSPPKYFIYETSVPVDVDQLYHIVEISVSTLIGRRVDVELENNGKGKLFVTVT